MTSSQSLDNIPQTDSILLRPADAARQLGLPASTLRRWSRRFAAFLSPEANGVVHADGGRGHRRYTPQDLAVLARCKALLSEGRTFAQAAQALESAFQPDVVIVQGEVDEEAAPSVGPAADAEPLQMVREEEARDLGQLMAQTLSSLSGSQQMIITGQQTERELLGVVLQDNFNLKEDNKKLRERMVETERRIFEMKREMAKTQTAERERMRQMEAYLFQLQRQMDDLTRRRPAPPVAFTPAVMPMPPAPSPAPPSPQPAGVADAGAKGEALAPAGDDAPAAGKRSFWEWLFGR